MILSMDDDKNDTDNNKEASNDDNIDNRVMTLAPWIFLSQLTKKSHFKRMTIISKSHLPAKSRELWWLSG